MKKLTAKMTLIASVLCMALVLGGCGKKNETNEKTKVQSEETTSGKIKAVATIFPCYDFIRQIGKNHVDVEMLLPPGAESHSYEPTPKDIQKLEGADLFLYVGGDSDEWVKKIVKSLSNKPKKVETMMKMVPLEEEVVVEGMTPEKEEEGEEEEGVEYDEHVWTSPKNAILIVEKLEKTLAKLDPGNAKDYKTNADAYIEKLKKLDASFEQVVKEAPHKEIIVGDRFPFKYLADAYHLKYYAAFPGCSTDTEANASTIAFLTDKVKKDHIPVVFHIELSNEKVAKSICEATGAKLRLLHAVHNVSKEDFDKGVTYLELMQNNVKALKEALQ